MGGLYRPTLVLPDSVLEYCQKYLFKTYYLLKPTGYSKYCHV